MTISGSLKKNKLAVLLLILALLLIIYFAASGINRHIENSENEKSSSDLVITDVDADEITGVTYSDGSASMAFEKKEDTWIYADNADFPLDQSLVETVADDFASMNGTRRLSDPDDGEDYGFAEPSYEVTLTEEDGSTLTVKVGNTTGEEYYITADDGSTVFTAEGTVLDDLVFDENALIECEDFPSISSDNLKKITITKGSSNKSYNSKNNEDDCEEYGTELSSIAFTDCVTYDMDSDDASEYGLDEDNRTTVSVTYKDTETDKNDDLVFYIGSSFDEDDDEYVYMQLKGSSMVYKVSTYSLEKLV